MENNKAAAKGRKTKITPQLYTAVKVLQKGGATQVEAAEYMRLSRNTVGWIYRSEDIDDYKRLAYLAIHKSDGNQKQAVVKEVSTPQAPMQINLSGNYQLNRIYEQLKEQNEHLKLISNKLAFIVDELVK